MYKLQLITDAKKVCPDVVIVLGEDLTRFRNASKQLYAFLSSFSWNARCERLGFDEVWLDVSDLVDSNVATLNPSSLGASFFRLSKHDPTLGFCFDATKYAGHIYPDTSNETQSKLFVPSPARQACMNPMLARRSLPETQHAPKVRVDCLMDLCYRQASRQVLFLHDAISASLILRVSCFSANYI